MNYFEEVMSECGYTPMTSFWNDFSIADKFGIDAIKDMFNRAFEEWKNDVEYVTELVLVLNHKIWFWYETDEAKAKVYNDLWIRADAWCCENFTGADADYYYNVTD